MCNRRILLTIVSFVLLTGVVGGSPASALNQDHTIGRAEVGCPEAVKARNFLREAREDGYLVIGAGGDVGESVRCGCQASHGGQPRRGVKVSIESDIVTPNGTLVNLGSDNGRSRRDGWFWTGFDVPPGVDGTLRSEVRVGGSKRMDSLDCHCASGMMLPPCVPDNTTACLDGGRFRVEAEFTDPFDDTVRPLILDSARNNEASFFFSPANWELLVKVLDACNNPNFNSFWVFAAATTDVEFELTVTDTETGLVKEYENPLGTPFEPIQDTQAFLTCP